MSEIHFKASDGRYDFWFDFSTRHVTEAAKYYLDLAKKHKERPALDNVKLVIRVGLQQEWGKNQDDQNQMLMGMILAYAHAMKPNNIPWLVVMAVTVDLDASENLEDNYELIINFTYTDSAGVIQIWPIDGQHRH